MQKDYRDFELDDNEWIAIQLVANWLVVFRNATTYMSTTTTSVLSTSYDHFLMLQDEIRQSINNLPDGTQSQLKDGLIAAHSKLAEYLFLFNESPYFLWASSTYIKSLKFYYTNN